MSKLFEEMAQGTVEARAYMEGSRDGYQVTLPESIDVRGIRNPLRFSQDRFAAAFGFSVDAVRHWESGRRTPEAAPRALLMVIDHDPQLVMRVLTQSPSAVQPLATEEKATSTGSGQRASLRPDSIALEPMSQSRDMGHAKW
jgi:putative transcriptional regulator